ncbi:single-stranded DNA-binding protein [Arthrobacter sp. H35-D1]|uniref:single-stranded DNA-binding protein n=1 Tax=Arthrobacter sp. H35-D1 TaxID=3046202 RepID=UPI0024BA00C5|nr:single-stranded DNA-binding protein [Arthrobacter sp. H35-D1]MDJ0313902.1 single-stranded DNA-binding protein [Arthrobacter sp. H35-D1]
MANHVSIRGFMSSEFEMRNTPNGLVIGNFRMGSTERRKDPVTNAWVDGHTNWYHISAFRSLAQNAVSSIHKGDRILVIGRLSIKTFLRKDGTTGTNVEIEADSIGPDLQFGTSHYTRMASARPAGQPGDSHETGDASQEGHLSVAANHGEVPEDSLPASSGQDGEDGDDGGDDDNLDGDAAAVMDNREHGDHDDGGGLRDGELADLETGEILKEAAPF